MEVTLEYSEGFRFSKTEKISIPEDMSGFQLMGENMGKTFNWLLNPFNHDLFFPCLFILVEVGLTSTTKKFHRRF